MRQKFPGIILCLSVLWISACGDRQQAEKTEVATSAPAASPAPTTSVTKHSAEAFFETTTYALVGSSAHTFSPDGSSLLMSSDATGVFNAYALPVDGSAAVQLTDSDDNAVFAVSWFPDDERILYTYDGGGNELNHVIVREIDGTNRDLTPGDELKAAFLKWSDDGKYFYLVTTERNQTSFDIYRYATNDYSREIVYENPGFQISDISADGRWVALDKPRTSADSDIYVLDLADDNAEPLLVTEHEGNIEYSTYEISPENKLIYSTNEHGEFAQAWSYDLSDGTRKESIKADWDVSYVLYSHSGRYRVFGVNADARTVVQVRDMESGEELTLPELPAGDLRNVRFSADDTHMALIVNADDSPSNIHIIDLVDGNTRQLTSALNPEIDQSHLVQSEVIRYKSFDGLEIPSILYKPHGASAENPVPAMVLVHGGPGGQTRTGYRAMVQHLVNHGYAILGANNRGSSGYGKTFYHLDDRHHGEDDLQDIVYGRKYLESLDWVDGSKVGVIGGSYGGYMVAAALTFEPEAFEVGIDIFGVTNWVRTLESIPPWWESFKESLYDEMGDPATDAERHRRISPLFHAENIVKPTLVVQGANDPRVLQVESDELVAAIQANEVPVEYLVFPDEGHGFRKKQNRITASDAYVRFLDTYLKGESGPD
ncbi:MAG: S9 family peptidase [Gammaproteobacteria bacterium]|nr:MAG: S9 family peptidase [Gammaproteobacteria bacterium]